MSSSAEKCPVDHGALAASADKCPVDHTSRSSWASLLPPHDSNPSPRPNGAPAHLPLVREISSIPKVDGGNWVYPSQAQFYSAMARKNHNPQASDMKVIVPIHNAVNERAWAEVMKWEAGQGGDKCGGVRLVSFKGRPQDLSPRARWRSLIGYSPPFDRHDWVIDRCGTRVRYIIDFYTGHTGGSPSGNLSFYLDARPALDNWDGVRMRVERFCERWIGRSWSSPVPPEHTTSRS
ncbi:cytochrome C1 heme lyase [Laetiporus sulphureus 93-53]|uniref:Holocytochrome c-type synthase n=1 Tax=Laetiporus sulphureus 93-53 TaxID=1314785 RepID=A0A165H9S5_9APHY|nr:cytochrome C1 heme lyase [Laetiporus sulphureus 93-53]KZT11438.1 cytochrome C1 heme lyase [Laetiporus sulphureus 93-53]